ncbi:FUSC family protein [Amycolatopsis rhabdoformis]|uniref:FUSC family protein n=1 Tax=Amycolatopsis rhabdoformis TaxID=1448059 RepID=A0ABZ1IL22_9PSEU|nr:FUSC family protein [Amycolatopsis rhabdoformis]WSE34294.1 FUSC family protein [Amycolatopsis rhabdoformis]
MASSGGRVRELVRAEGPFAVRIVVTAAVAWQVCVWLGARQPPVFAVVVPLVSLRNDPYTTLNVSLARLAGVVSGLALGIAVLRVLHPSTLALAVVLALALAVGIVLRIGGTLNIQVAVSALLVFANTDPDSYAVFRLWQTAVGAVVTVVLAPLLLPTNPARAFVAELNATAADLARNLRAPADEEAVRAVETRARELPRKLAAATKAVRGHPVWRRTEPARLAPLAPLARTAADIGTLVRIHFEDTAEFAARGEPTDTTEVATPLADAVEATLTGTPDPPALATAEAALLHNATTDGTRLGAIARRPLRRIILVLKEPPAA